MSAENVSANSALEVCALLNTLVNCSYLDSCAWSCVPGGGR